MRLLSCGALTILPALPQVNSETDFVARNDIFQALASGAARTALATLPRAARGAHGTDGGGGDAALLAALAAAPLGGGAGGGTVAAGVLDAIARVRENVVLRRAAALGGPGALVAGYVHNAAAPGLGGVGVLVALRAVSGAPLAPAPALAAAARRVAMHVAAARPLAVARADVPPRALERERALAEAAAAAAGKAGPLAEKVIAGRLAKFYAGAALGEQAFVFDEAAPRVAAWLAAQAKAAGAPPVEVAAFAHFVVGEAGAPAGAGGEGGGIVAVGRGRAAS